MPPPSPSAWVVAHLDVGQGQGARVGDAGTMAAAQQEDGRARVVAHHGAAQVELGATDHLDAGADSGAHGLSVADAQVGDGDRARQDVQHGVRGAAADGG